MQYSNVAVALAKRFVHLLAALAGRIALSAAAELDEAGLELTEAHEGCRLTAYRDAVGVLTIGWGHTGHDVHDGLTITREQAEELLRQDMLIAEMCVNADVTMPLTQNQFDALVDLVFNIGCASFGSSTLRHKLNLGDYRGAAAEFGKWNHAGGEVLEGLTRRRAAEAELFLRPDVAAETVSISASRDYSRRTEIVETILEDFAEQGPIWTAFQGWQAE